jgi:hypothetical protein
VLRGGIGRGADNDRSDVDDDEIRCLQPGPRCLSLVAYLLPFFLVVTVLLFSASIRKTLCLLFVLFFYFYFFAKKVEKVIPSTFFFTFQVCEKSRLVKYM